MDDDRQGIDLVAVDQQVHLHHVGRAVFEELVVHRRIAARHRLQAIEEVQHDLAHRQLVGQVHGAAMVGEIALQPALAGAQRDDGAHVLLRHEDDDLDDGLADLGNACLLGHARRVLDALDGPIGQHHLIDDGGRRGDEIHVVLALQALLHDVHVQHAQEAAAKAETQRLRDLGLELQRGIVELELFQGVTQRVIFAGLHRVQAGEHGGLDLLEARQRLAGGGRDMGDGVAHLGVLELLHAGDDEAHLSGRKRVTWRRARREDAQLVTLVLGVGGHHADAVARPERAVDDPYQHHHAHVVVEPRVDDQRLQRCVRIALGRRNAGDDGVDDLVQPHAGLGTGRDGIAGVDADHVLDLGAGAVGISRRQVHLVEHRHHLDTQVDGGVAVGHGLCLDTL